MNASLDHAVESDTPRNGVLTAIEDFLTSFPGLELLVVSGFHGLALLIPEARSEELASAIAPWRFAAPIREYVERLESARVHLFTELCEEQERRSRMKQQARASAGRYLELLKQCLTGSLIRDQGWTTPETVEEFSAARRDEGRDWPLHAATMVGRRRLDSLHRCIEDLLIREVPGDLIETGVWRGGAVILMRAVLEAWGVSDRYVWAADSFAGFPPKTDLEGFAADDDNDFSGYWQLAVAIDEVKTNFATYGLLDKQVRFLEGWFRDTLPGAPIERLALIRLDGDLYESTIDALEALYPKLGVGGYLIVDDYGAIEACRQAVHDYRAAHQICDEIHEIDWTGVYWIRYNS
jgi:hypothetical protein